MDAVAYFKAYERMCDSFDSKNNITGKPCVGCPLDDIGRGCHMNDLTNNAEECVAAVEKWAKEHPVKTRQTQPLQYNVFDRTGVVWKDRASNPEEKDAVERAYRCAERVLLGEKLLPDDVIFQSENIQGTEIVVYQDGMYFCR